MAPPATSAARRCAGIIMTVARATILAVLLLGTWILVSWIVSAGVLEALVAWFEVSVLGQTLCPLDRHPSFCRED